MIRRFAGDRICEALADTPVVLIHGPRQCGKSTLGEHIARSEGNRQIVTLDDPVVRAFANRDPVGFLDAHQGPLFIDEVQRAPGLLTSLKLAVDRQRLPGRFLLSGSANLMAVPKAAESLAGRMEIVELRPLAQAEIEGQGTNPIDSLVTGEVARSARPTTRNDLVERILRGGFPEPVQRSSARRRQAWFESYVRALLDRDIRDIANLAAMNAMPALLQSLARRSGNIVNSLNLAGEVSLPYTTLKRYLAILETVFLIGNCPAWHLQESPKLGKSPRLVFLDSGLQCSVAGWDADLLATDETTLRQATRNFLVAELMRLASTSLKVHRVLHIRTLRALELDAVLVGPREHLVGITVRLSATVHPDDGEPHRFFRDVCGDRFGRGIVLYLGADIVPIDTGITAVPISSLWS